MKKMYNGNIKKGKTERTRKKFSAELAKTGDTCYNGDKKRRSGYGIDLSQKEYI